MGSYMTKLIVPIFSMRSYETGLYSVLKDGNFQLQLSRANVGDVICVPFRSSDLEELQSFFPNHTFVHARYGKNALETRESFWKSNTSVIDAIFEKMNCDMIVTDITGYNGKYPVIFNFNITLDPENPREYIDKFIESDVDSVNRSIRTFVLNECQKDVLVDHGAEAHKIVVSQKVVKPEIIDSYLGKDALEIPLGSGIFHPFRISDKCYKFDDVYSYAQSKLRVIFCTDPNDTLDIKKYPGAFLFRPTKRDYYRVLLGKPTIVYHENPEKVFHPGLAEFIYFNADIISEYNIPKYEQVVINEGEDVWLT